MTPWLLNKFWGTDQSSRFLGKKKKFLAYIKNYFIMLGLIILWAFMCRFKVITRRLLLTWCNQAFFFQFLLMDPWPSPPHIFQCNGCFDLSFLPQPRMLSWIGTVSSGDLQCFLLNERRLRPADSKSPLLYWTCLHNIHIVWAW